MANTQQIREHMEVIGADDVHVGVVYRVEPSNGIKLTRSDPLAEGEHHYVPLDWVERVDAQVHLNKDSSELIALWKRS